MSAERYTLDANIIFYALDADASRKHMIAQALLHAALRNDCVLTLQALAETYHAISRKAPSRVEESSHILEDLASFVPVVHADFKAFTDAMHGQRTRRTQFWDTMLWATAKKHGCKIILTEDAQDRPQIGGVRYLDPFRASSSELQPFL
ncbi:PIN domain-containing protein [Terriglobus sp. RCC_193]|uniref:PIN domain-containing protein n=1 Tax=Terriglobus sp. RCC_193 TaxID=3239218 RepID=UPI003524B2D8